MSDSEESEPPDADEPDLGNLGDPPSPSLASSAPPPPQPQQVGVGSLPDHPVWRAARGSGAPFPPAGGRGRRASKPPSEVGDGPRFEAISVAELEARQFSHADGADSYIDSADEEEAEQEKKDFSRVPERKRERPLVQADEEEEEDGAHHHRRKLDSLMHAAAFGGQSGGHYGRTGGSQAGSQSDVSSSRRREAMKNAFPVRGVKCVGCALPNKISVVDKFVQNNISKMTETALWKMAALVYRREIVEVTAREGALAPSWKWRDIQVHYELHCSSSLVARHKQLRVLQSESAARDHHAWRPSPRAPRARRHAHTARGAPVPRGKRGEGARRQGRRLDAAHMRGGVQRKSRAGKHALRQELHKVTTVDTHHPKLNTRYTISDPREIVQPSYLLELARV